MYCSIANDHFVLTQSQFPFHLLVCSSTSLPICLLSVCLSVCVSTYLSRSDATTLSFFLSPFLCISLSLPLSLSLSLSFIFFFLFSLVSSICLSRPVFFFHTHTLSLSLSLTHCHSFFSQEFHTTLQRLTDILLEEYKVPDAAVNKYRLKTLKPFEVAYDVKRNVDAAMARLEIM